jgi:hypothetical protein
MNMDTLRIKVSDGIKASFIKLIYINNISANNNEIL